MGHCPAGSLTSVTVKVLSLSHTRSGSPRYGMVYLPVTLSVKMADDLVYIHREVGNHYQCSEGPKKCASLGERSELSPLFTC